MSLAQVRKFGGPSVMVINQGGNIPTIFGQKKAKTNVL